MKKEILKLLETGIIYPISDSKWVSPIHCIPKKGGMMVITNEKNELIPTRTVMGWRVCIDYKKLNDANIKITSLCPSSIRCWSDWLVTRTTVFWMVTLV